ncbi:hypothetical protein MRX96_035632 [Rhipicephalus microplus]
MPRSHDFAPPKQLSRRLKCAVCVAVFRTRFTCDVTAAGWLASRPGSGTDLPASRAGFGVTIVGRIRSVLRRSGAVTLAAFVKDQDRSAFRDKHNADVFWRSQSPYRPDGSSLKKGSEDVCLIKVYWNSLGDAYCAVAWSWLVGLYKYFCKCMRFSVDVRKRLRYGYPLPEDSDVHLAVLTVLHLELLLRRPFSTQVD